MLFYSVNEQTKNGTELVTEYFDKYEGTDGFKNFIDTTEVADRDQASYAKSVEVTNLALKKASLSSKAAAAGMKVLNIAMNMGIMLAVSWAIEAIVKGIDNLVHADKKAIDKANEVTSAWNFVPFIV